MTTILRTTSQKERLEDMETVVSTILSHILGKRAANFAQLPPRRLPIGDGQRHQIPKFARMVELPQVAKLVHN